MHIKQERRCVACRQAKQQMEMIRIAKVGGKFIVDINNKLGGRGAYVCADKNCIQLTIKKHLLNRSFKSNIDNSIYELLEEYEKNN